MRRMGYKTGDVLTVRKGIIVHGCNTEGVMGAGIARTIAETFPNVLKEYEAEHKMNGLPLGSIIPVQIFKNVWIVNAITQTLSSNHYTGSARPVSYDAIADCFQAIVQWREAKKLDLPVVFPKIGAGLGGGNWNIIQGIINHTLPSNIIRRVYVFKP